MITLIVSDVHSNEPALEAVLASVRRKRIDRIFCMGDFVGYGAQPNQVLDRLRTAKWKKHYIRGNHDRVAAGVEDGVGFNYAARSAALWTRDHLSGLNRHFLQGLKTGPLSVSDDVMLCHGSPFDEDEYVFTEHDALRIFRRYSPPVIFFGHTHLPSVFMLTPTGDLSGTLVQGGAKLKLHPHGRYLINPGSVGQPRDRNTQAAFAVYDDVRRIVQFLRVGYDISRAQEPILKAGLPRILADRLDAGT